jgi:peroxiredoxin
MALTLREGDPFPRLPNLGDLEGSLGRRPVVLFFYPKAASPG